jgi:hypothetical protein
MKHDEQVDELFRNGFNPDFSEEIPTDFLADINQRLNDLEQKKRKKRTPVYWWVAGVFSMIGLMLFAYSFRQSQNRYLISKENKNSGVTQNKFLTQPVELTKNKELIPTQKPSQITSNEGNVSIIQKILTQNNHFVNSNKSKITQQYSQANLGKSSISRLDMKNEIITKTEFENNSVDPLTFQSNEALKAKYEIITDSNSFISKVEDTTINSKEKVNQVVENHISTIKPIIKDSVKKVKSTRGYSLSFYSGVSEIFHEILAPSPMAITVVFPWDEYRDKRKLEEKSITSWDMAIRFGLPLKKFSISTGIEYFVWGERTDYSNVSYNAQHQNVYRYFNIPLLIGYQIQKGTFGIQPNAGISTGFLAQETSGYYLNATNSASSYQASISKFSSTFHAGCELAYFSQSGIKVSINPIFRKSLTKVVQSDVVRNRYSSLGLQLGIGYRW